LPLLRVDTDVMRESARRFRTAHQDLLPLGKELRAAAADAPSYDGQYGPWLRDLADQRASQVDERARALEEMAGYLEALAEAYDEAERAAKSGALALGAAMLAMAEDASRLRALSGWLQRWRDPTGDELWERALANDPGLLLEDGWAPWAGELRRSAEALGLDPEAQQELARLYLLGLPREGQAAAYPLLGRGYGLGMTDDWKTFNGGKDAAQYLNLYDLLGIRGLPTGHWNLCGQLAAIAVLGLHLKEGLLLFSRTSTGAMMANEDGKLEWQSFTGEVILRDPTMGTDAQQLADFFGEAGRPHSTILRATDNLHPEPMADAGTIREWLGEDKALVALVNIDKTQHGLLRPLDQATSSAAHWVSVLDVSETRSGETLVRVYNPYMNEEQFYSWDYFQAAWQSTKGNDYTHYALLVVDPLTPPLDER